MGSDKALLDFDGVRLLDRVYRRLSSAADPVFFAPGRVGRLGSLPADELPDARANSGPLGGLVSGLERSPHDLLALIAVDMPWCSAPLLSEAAELWDGEDVVVPVDDKGPQVLHALYSRAALEPLRTALEDGRLSLRALLKDLKVRYLDQSVWSKSDASGRFAFNLNRPEDLALLAERP